MNYTVLLIKFKLVLLVLFGAHKPWGLLCLKLCSLTALCPASAGVTFPAASTFPSARHSALMVSSCSARQRESSRTSEDVSLWSSATP